MATGTTAFLYDEGTDALAQHCNCKKLTFNWTSTAGGAAADTTRKIVGRIIKAQVIPGTSGNQPTNNFTTTITDTNGIDILASCKATLATNSNASNVETYLFLKDTSGTPVTQAFSPVVCDQLTITIGSAGNAKSGSLVIYYVTF